MIISKLKVSPLIDIAALLMDTVIPINDEKKFRYSCVGHFGTHLWSELVLNVHADSIIKHQSNGVDIKEPYAKNKDQNKNMCACIYVIY